jgi:hypothetical protein
MTQSPFKWHTSWTGIVISDDNLLLPNTWTFTLEYDAVSDDMLHRDIAMQRLEFMVEEKFQTATWTNVENPWVDILYEKMDTFLITLPGDPYDSLIAAVAMLKAQSITEGVFEIHRCSVISKLGYNVENIIELEEATEISQSIDYSHYGDGPWFSRKDAGFTDILCIRDDVTTLVKDSSDWKKHNLNWDYYQQSGDNLAVFKNYKHSNHNERWIPLVIKGGAEDTDED